MHGVGEALGDHVAHGALGVGHDHAERRRGHLGAGGFVLDEVDADLRTVAVGQDDFMAIGDHADDGGKAFARIRELLGDGPLGAFLDNGVPAQCDHDRLAVGHCVSFRALRAQNGKYIIFWPSGKRDIFI